MESNLIIKDKQKNKLEKAFEILKTMASKPSGLIGLTIVSVSYTHLRAHET